MTTIQARNALAHHLRDCDQSVHRDCRGMRDTLFLLSLWQQVTASCETILREEKI